MVGVCLTGVGLVGVVKSVRGLETAVDELLTVSALLFGCSTALYFSLLRHPDQANRLSRDHWADALFFLGLGLLLLACVVFAIGFESELHAVPSS